MISTWQDRFAAPHKLSITTPHLFVWQPGKSDINTPWNLHLVCILVLCYGYFQYFLGAGFLEIDRHVWDGFSWKADFAPNRTIPM